MTCNHCCPKSLSVVVICNLLSFPGSRANVGCSSTGLEADRKCDVWVHVSTFLGQNALCGGETCKHKNRCILAEIKQKERIEGGSTERGSGVDLVEEGKELSMGLYIRNELLNWPTNISTQCTLIIPSC